MALERQKEEEKERKEEEMKDILRRFRAALPVSDAEWEAWQAWRGIGSTTSGMRRKRKKTRLRCVSRLIEGTNLAILVRRLDLTHPPPTKNDSQPDHHQNVHYSTRKSDDEPIQSK